MESGLRQCERPFRPGVLLRPSASELNFLDLVRAVAALCGVEDLQAGPGVGQLVQRIGPTGPYALILVDGLGQTLMEQLPEDSCFRRSWFRSLQTVFPSTTATALTTLATGEWPRRYGIPCWWTYLEEHRISTVTVRFQGRFTGKPLERFGLKAEDVFPVPSFWPRIKNRSLSILPAHIAQTSYSRYVNGGAPRVGYKDIDEATSILRESLLKARPPGKASIGR